MGLGVLVLISLLTALASLALGVSGALKREARLKRRAHVTLNVALVLFSMGTVNVGAAVLLLAGYALLYGLTMLLNNYFDQTLPAGQLWWLRLGARLTHWALTAILALTGVPLLTMLLFILDLKFGNL